MPKKRQRSMSMNITIMTTIMKTTIMSMITNIIMNMTRTAPADATITKNMSIITTTNMNIITIMKTMTTTMSTIMNMTKTAPADAMTIITVFLGGYLIIKGQLTPGQLTIFSQLTWALANPMRQLGNLINEGRTLMMSPNLRYQLIYPTIVLSIVTISFYVVGNAFSDAADPKNHRHR